jgi:hypothetical protein
VFKGGLCAIAPLKKPNPAVREARPRALREERLVLKSQVEEEAAPVFVGSLNLALVIVDVGS